MNPLLLVFFAGVGLLGLTFKLAYDQFNVPYAKTLGLVKGQAIDAGATLIREPQNHFYGERSGTVRDPFGHEWNIGHEIEKVSPEEMQRRYTEMFSGS